MMAQLPKGWRHDRLKRLAVVTNGSDPKTEGDVPVYGSGGCSFKTCGEYKEGPAVLLGRKGTIDVPRFVEGKYWNVDTAFDVKPLCGGTTTGRDGVPSPSARTSAADGTAALPSSRGKIDIRFLYYVAHTFDYRFYSTQTTVPSMTQKDYRNMLLRVPPRPEQERIAAFLDAKCADVDKAIAAKRRQLEGIDGIWNNVLVKAVTLGLNSRCTFIATGDVRIPQMPKGWRLEKIARCFDLIGSGTTPKSHMQDYYDGNIPWLQSGDLHGRYVDHTEKYVNETACRDCNLRIYRAPFIAVAMYGASIANLSIVRIDACTNQACCTLCLPRHLIDPDFAYFAVLASREALLQSAHGGTQPNISREVVRRLKIALPPKREQAEIAKYLDKRRANLDALAANLRRQIETLEEYRKSLIHECVTGARSVT